MISKKRSLFIFGETGQFLFVVIAKILTSKIWLDNLLLVLNHMKYGIIHLVRSYIFRKTNISYPQCMCAYQRVKKDDPCNKHLRFSLLLHLKSVTVIVSIKQFRNKVTLIKAFCTTQAVA